MPKPRPSEWGKLNAGQSYGILATDLGRAIFGVQWGKYELPLIFYLIEHSWGVAKTKNPGGGWPDPVACAINFNDLARQWGFPRQRVYEARDRLKAVNFMVESAEGFWLNKDAHAWGEGTPGAPGFRPLLSPAMLAYAAGARFRKRHKQASVTSERDNVSRSSVTECHGPACHDVTVQRDNVSRSSVTNGAAPPEPPLEERAQDLRFKKMRDREETPQPPLGEGGAAGGSIDAWPKAPPEFAELCRKADRIKALADVAFAQKLRGAWEQDGKLSAWWADIADRRVWLDTLNELAGQPPADRTVRFYVGMVKRRRHAPGGSRPESKAAPHPPVHRAPEGYTKT